MESLDHGSVSSSTSKTPLGLQIDVPLAISTSSSESSGFSTPIANVTSIDNQGDEWEMFYKKRRMTPPKVTQDVNFRHTVASINKLLEVSPSKELETFEDLAEEQQAVAMFFVLKEMHSVFESFDQAAKVLADALVPESRAYKRLMSFVRQGGDRAHPAKSLLIDKFKTRVESFANDPKAITVFKIHPDMKPFLQLQREDSYICTFNASAALLYYFTQGITPSRGETVDCQSMISALKINISRFIRDEISGREIANVALTENKGLSLFRVLSGLVKSFGVDDKEEAVKIPVSRRSQERTIKAMELFLEDGHPFVFQVGVFPGLADPSITEYWGKLSKYYGGDVGKRPSFRCYHALLCIGITPATEKKPAMLLVQDSSERRPAFSIGIDLLFDMGIETLDFCTVPFDWVCKPNAEYTVSPRARAMFCGSPMGLDDNGLPFIVVPEKPKRERRDMSRYLHKTEPGQPLVFEVW